MLRKRLFAPILMLLLLLPLLSAAAQDSAVINLVKNPNADYAFEEGVPLLEIVFPRVFSSDCTIIRFGDQVMMVDASTKNTRMRNRIYTACDTIGVDHIDIAYNSHPHDDHIDGFQYVHEYAPISKFLITFPEDFNARMKEAIKFMKANDIPIESVGNGDVITLGENS